MLSSPPAENQIHRVNMGELMTASSPDWLRAILGSCVGVALHWEERHVFGLAHILLPGGENMRPGLLDTRYTDRAICALLRRMRVPPERTSEVQAVVAGGAYMFTGGRSAPDVGRKNIDKSRAQLEHFGVTIIADDIGGRRARSIVVDCGRARVQTYTMLDGPDGTRRVPSLDVRFTGGGD